MLEILASKDTEALWYGEADCEADCEALTLVDEKLIINFTKAYLLNKISTHLDPSSLKDLAP
jgi:hypothetical protein